MTEGLEKIVEELGGEQCRCGSLKDKGRTFCLPCYDRLPPVMKRALYRLLDRGYAASYRAAVEYLDSLKELGIS